MQIKKPYPQIEDLKDQIINQALIIGTVLGFFAYFLSLTRYHRTGFELTFVTDLLIITLLLGITILRKKLSMSFKSYITISAIYVVFLTDLIKLGVYSGNKVLIILIPFLSLLALSKNKAISIYIFTTLTFIVVAYFHISGKLIAPVQDHTDFSAYLINLLLIIAVGSIVLIIQGKFNLTYSRLITELEQKNSQLTEKERNYREIFNASTDAIFIHDLDGRILDVNRSMANIYGYEPEDIADLTIEDLSSQEKGFTVKEATDLIQKAVKGEPQIYDWQAKKKNGDFFWVETAGVAHEINNPLNFISGGIQGLETYFKENIDEHTEDVSLLINSVHVGVKRVAEIVSSLNRYSRRDDLPDNSCNINSIIDDCLVMLNYQLKDRIEVRKEYTDLPYITACAEGKLHQALLNIIANAGHAIKNRGTITINTSIDDKYILISVRDTGSGISKGNLGKIFDPFFTTKDPGKGTGLGLSITYNIIKEHQGFIEAESEPGKGTNIIVRLPINENGLKES